MGRRFVASLALAVACVALVLCGVMWHEEEKVQTPEQIAMLEMWNQPYVSTVVPDGQHLQMLWNAANDDPQTDMHSSQETSNSDGFSDDSGDSDSGDSDSSNSNSNEDTGSESYLKYDTDSTSSGSDDSMDSDLKNILPSSELKGTSLASSNNHQWDTSKLSNNDDWDQHSTDSSWAKDASAANSHSSAWLKSHSWDSGKNLKLKQELKKMYHKGINAISKSIAKQAAEESNNSFFSKWAGSKSKTATTVHGKKAPLSDSDMKLYKEAESSVKKEEEKKAPLIKAVHAAAAKIAEKRKGKSTSKDSSREKHDKEVKAKLKAADRLSASLSKKKAHKTSIKDLLKESAKIAVQSKDAKSAQDRKIVAANAKKLQEEIKEDFSHATAIADDIQTQSAKLVGSKLKGNPTTD